MKENDIKDIGTVKNMMAQVLEKSYSPYSKFKVGAILYTKDFKIYVLLEDKMKCYNIEELLPYGFKL